MFWDVVRCSEAFSLFLSGSKVFQKVPSHSLAFCGAVAFLGVVMGCMNCERSLSILRHSPRFPVHLIGC